MKKLWGLTGVLLVAFFLRVLQLDARNVWYDEAFAILYAEKSFAQMWYGTVTQVQGAAADVHPLFFYSLLHGWMDAVGQSAFAARFLSVAFSVATVAVMYRLAREWFDARTARIAAVLVALAPFAIAYAQEARMYAQLGFFAALFVLAYGMVEKPLTPNPSPKVRGEALTPDPSPKRRGEKMWWWVVFVLSGAGMLYSHNLAVFFGAAFAVWIVWHAWRQRNVRSLASFALAGMAIFLLWSPWLLLLPGQLGKIEQAYWIGRPDALTVTQTVLSFTTGFDNARVPLLLVPFALVAAVLLLVLMVLQIARGGWRDARVQFFALLVFLPPLMIFVVSQWRPVYITRALMPSFLMLLFLIAWLLTRVPRGMVYIVSGALLVLGALSYVFYFTYADFPRPPFRDALAFLRTELRAGDMIAHDNKMTFFPMYYYARAQPLPQNFIMDPPGAGSDTLAYPTQKALGLFALSRDDALNAHARVWFVMFREARQESTQAENLEWLKSHYTLRQEKIFHDLELYLFEK